MPPEQSPDAPGATSERLLNDRYELGEKVGDGSFFTVYRGRDSRSGRAVAIKILNEEYAADREFSDRLRSEALAAIQLDHAHIVPVVDAWFEDGRVAIATEFVRGINLKERVQRVAPFPLAVAVDIAAAISEALEYAASLGFSHGDLRPENILVTPEGEVKLSDFGVAAAFSASSRLQMSALVQCAHYLPPEIAQGKPPSPPSDVYSLGAILFEMLAGQPPFQAETPFAIAVKHLHDAPPALRRFNPGAPRAVEGIILKCLQKEPAARYPTPGALLEDLRNVRDALRYGKALNWTPTPEPGAPLGTRPSRAAPPPAAPANRAPATDADAPVRAAPPKAAPERRELERGEPSTRLLLVLPLMALVLAGLVFGLFVYFTQAPKDAIVPSIRGVPQAEAERRLAERGLTLKVVREVFDEKVPSGTVILLIDEQEGSQVKQGSAIDVWVSKGVEPAVVPNVVEMEEAEARTRLKDARLTIGPIQREYDEVVAKGTIISQDPPSGTQLKPRSRVTMVVSKGPEELPPPEPDTPPEVAPVPPTPNTTTDGFTTDGTTTDGGDGTLTDSATTDATLEGAIGDSTANQEREFDINTEIEGKKGYSRLRIILTDEQPRREVANQLYRKGQTVHHRIKAKGSPGGVRIEVYVNGKLVKDMLY